MNMNQKLWRAALLAALAGCSVLQAASVANSGFLMTVNVCEVKSFSCPFNPTIILISETKVAPFTWRNTYRIDGPGDGIPWSWNIKDKFGAGLGGETGLAVTGTNFQLTQTFANSIAAKIPGALTQLTPVDSDTTDMAITIGDTSVPTLSGWAALALVAVLLGGGMAILRLLRGPGA
ncbi:MAG TPA: hypothetical protein VJS92_05075 [Candidatus Polarisedimenticolaceae bacterium]|nr:hypothetical protein [Candidatus Polarisedimenticolaceae bacterium]